MNFDDLNVLTVPDAAEILIKNQNSFADAHILFTSAPLCRRNYAEK